MNSFTTALRASTLRRAPFALRHQPLAGLRPARLSRPQLPLAVPLALQARGAASSVSGRPGSQTLGHAATNIKEEVGNSAADVAKGIAGGNMTADAVSPSEQTFVRAPRSAPRIRVPPG